MTVCVRGLQVGYDMTRLAAQRLFDQTGLTPADVQVVELHDCFSANELITYEALGLYQPGVIARGSLRHTHCNYTIY